MLGLAIFKAIGYWRENGFRGSHLVKILVIGLGLLVVVDRATSVAFEGKFTATAKRGGPFLVAIDEFKLRLPV